MSYEGKCSCGFSYIGETKRNVDVRFKEHCDIRRKSEPAKHLHRNPLHTFDWKVISKAPMLTMKRKILEAYHIMSKRPVLSKNIELPSLTIFLFLPIVMDIMKISFPLNLNLYINLNLR